MPISAREYVSTLELGDRTGCRRVMNEFATAIHALNPDGSRARVSFFARVLFSTEDIADECLNPNEVFAVTSGAFPCLWVNLTYDPDRLELAEIEVVEARFGLRLIGTAESKASFL